MNIQADEEALEGLDHDFYDKNSGVWIDVRARYSTGIDLFDNPQRSEFNVNTHQTGLAYGLRSEDFWVADAREDKQTLSEFEQEWDGEIGIHGFRIVAESGKPFNSKNNIADSVEEAYSQLRDNSATLIFHVDSSQTFPLESSPVQVNYDDGVFHFSDNPYSEKSRRRTVRELKDTLEDIGQEYSEGELFVKDISYREKLSRNPFEFVKERLE